MRHQCARADNEADSRNCRYIEQNHPSILGTSVGSSSNVGSYREAVEFSMPILHFLSKKFMNNLRNMRVPFIGL